MFVSLLYNLYLSNSSRNVRLGEYDVSNEVGKPDCVTHNGGNDCTEGAVVIPIEMVITHPDYSDTTIKRSDVALIKMSKSAPYSGK